MRTQWRRHKRKNVPAFFCCCLYACWLWRVSYEASQRESWPKQHEMSAPPSCNCCLSLTETQRNRHMHHCSSRSVLLVASRCLVIDLPTQTQIYLHETKCIHSSWLHLFVMFHLMKYVSSGKVYVTILRHEACESTHLRGYCDVISSEWHFGDGTKVQIESNVFKATVKNHNRCWDVEDFLSCTQQDRLQERQRTNNIKKK